MHLFLSLVTVQLLELEKPWTLILDDAMASSFVSPITDAMEDDKQLVGKLLGLGLSFSDSYPEY